MCYETTNHIKERGQNMQDDKNNCGLTNYNDNKLQIGNNRHLKKDTCATPTMTHLKIQFQLKQ